MGTPVDAGNEMRVLTPDDIEPAADVIARAFAEDPLTSFMLPNPRTRVSVLRKFFRAYGAAHIRLGRGFGVSQPLCGVAYWIFPHENEASLSLSLFLPLLFTSYPVGLWRARHVVAVFDALRERHAPEPHFYLDNIGVLAAARGQGVASRLILPFLRLADEQGVSVYTDTVTATNVPVYNHFGLETVAVQPVPGTGLTVWALKRPARPAE